jgi:hypothetical protein
MCFGHGERVKVPAKSIQWIDEIVSKGAPGPFFHRQGPEK